MDRKASRGPMGHSVCEVRRGRVVTRGTRGVRPGANPTSGIAYSYTLDQPSRAIAFQGNRISNDATKEYLRHESPNLQCVGFCLLATELRRSKRRHNRTMPVGLPSCCQKPPIPMCQRWIDVSVLVMNMVPLKVVALASCQCLGVRGRDGLSLIHI